MTKLYKLILFLQSLKKHENRKRFSIMFNDYISSISEQSQLLSRSSNTPYKAEVLELTNNSRILLVVHEFSRTGVPYAVLYLARAIFSLQGVRPVIISPVDGPIREEFEQDGFPTMVDPLLFSYQDYSSEACEFVAKFERVIVSSLASFGFIRYFRGIS